MTVDPRDDGLSTVTAMSTRPARPLRPAERSARAPRTRDVPTAVGLALGAVADLVFADPRRGHPVAGFGQAAAALERRTWRNSRPAGTAYAAVCVGTAAAVGTAGQRLTARRPLARITLTAAATWAVLGGTSLGRAATTMEQHLAAGDLTAARAQLSSLAGR